MKDQRAALQALSVKNKQTNTETLTLLPKIYQCIKPDNSLKAHFIYIHEKVINLLFTIFIKKLLQVS